MTQRSSTGREGPGEKVRRVSQRRELAVVTLGMVASIAGLGGVLAANPPGWAISQANAQPAITARESTVQEATTPANTASAKAGHDKAQHLHKKAQRRARASEVASADTNSTSTSKQEETTQAPVRRQTVARRTTPVYSAPTQTPSAAVSQGS